MIRCEGEERNDAGSQTDTTPTVPQKKKKKRKNKIVARLSRGKKGKGKGRGGRRLETKVDPTERKKKIGKGARLEKRKDQKGRRLR